jgi:hypothetical protein
VLQWAGESVHCPQHFPIFPRYPVAEDKDYCVLAWDWLIPRVPSYSKHYKCNNEEARRLFILRVKAMQAIEPRWPSNHDPVLDPTFVLRSEFLPQKDTFKKSMPHQILHCVGLPAGGPSSGGFTVVSREWKDAIEYFEPKRHRFFPFLLECEDGRQSLQHYIFQSATLLDGVAVAASGFRLERNAGGLYRVRPSPTYNEFAAQVVLRREVVSGHHLWLDPEEGQTFVSASLAERLTQLLHPRLTAVPVGVQ